MNDPPKMVHRSTVEKNLKKNIDSAIITNVEKQYTSLQKEKVFEKISAVIEKYYCDGMISLDTKFWDGNKCRITNTYSLLCEVQEILKIDLFKTVIAYEDMYTCDTFISYICRMLKEYR